MDQEGCEACLIQDPLDLLYFTGLSLSAGKLCLCKGNALLLVDGRYLQAAQEKAPMPVALDDKLAASSFFSSASSIWFDGQHTSYEAYLKWQESLHNRFASKTSFFKPLRMIKDSLEIEKMKKSAQLLWRGFEFLSSQLREGITEKEMARSFEIFCLQHGGEGLAFEPIIAFGPNSAMPHYRSQDVPLKKGDIVLIDIGVVVERYHSDMTRLVFYQTAHPELESLHHINKAAHDAALHLCRPGTKIGALDRAARDVMAHHGVEDLFLHSLGHGIGLETHEYPRIKWDGEDKDLLLQPGMVFTIEPGLYVPGLGGVRYEDTIFITETGYENLYPNK